MMDYVIQGMQGSQSRLSQVLARATIIAAMLGSSLALFNQSDAIFGAAEIRWLPLLLAYLTPFVVVSLSQILGIREAHRASDWMTEFHESFLRTLFSHGIVARAVVLSLAAGSITTAIVATASLQAGRGLEQLPVALIIQALALPVLFGAMSQALAFRRTIRATARSAAPTASR